VISLLVLASSNASSQKPASSGFAAYSLILLLTVLLLAGLFFARSASGRRMVAQRIAEGDEVLTTGGLYGIVDRVDSDRIWLEISPSVIVEVDRSAVARITQKAEQTAGSGEGSEGSARGVSSPEEGGGSRDARAEASSQ
jgi:preprotein translocase subunit YajC